jgi:hypothetical protein
MFLSCVASRSATLRLSLRLDLPVSILRNTDCTGLGDAFEPRRDIDAIAHQIAIVLLDHVPKMDADAKLDAALGRQAGVALDESALNLDRAAHRLDHAAELDNRAVADPLDDASVMRCDGGIDQIAAKAPKARKGSILIGAGEPAIADDIGYQDRG